MAFTCILGGEPFLRKIRFTIVRNLARTLSFAVKSIDGT